MDKKLLNGFLEGLGGAEFWNAHSRNLNRLAGSWVAALTRRAHLGGEDAESCNLNFVSLLQAADNGVNDCVYNLFGLHLRAAQDAVDLFNNACFVHNVKI